MATNEISAIELLGDTRSTAVTICTEAAVLAAKTNPVSATAHIDWGACAEDIEKKIEDMLDINLAATIADAWKDLREVKACADPAKHPPDETLLQPLLDHRVEASLKPYLDIAVGRFPAMRVHFEIAIDLEFQGAVATIQDSRIRAVRLGRCRGGATVKCEGKTVIERKTKYIDALGKIVLSDGIRIG